MKKSFFLLIAILLSNNNYGQNIKTSPLFGLGKNQQVKSGSASSELSILEMKESSDLFYEKVNPKKKGSGYKPINRFLDYWKYFTDQNGKTHSGDYLYQVFKNKIAQENPVNSTANWSNLGPKDLTYYNETNAIGRINAICVDPLDSNIWYVGAPSGGLWKSTDSGNNWIPIMDDLPQLGVSGIAINYENTEIIYAATGDDDAGASYSIGVMKSSDGGNSWQETGLTTLDPDGNQTYALNEIFIHPNNPEIIFVAGESGFFKSTDGANTFLKASFEGNYSKTITDFRLHPNNPEIIYAVSNDGFYKSIDGGLNFSSITSDVLPSEFSRAVIGVSEAEPSIVYFLVADTRENNYQYLGLYRSTDEAASFTKTDNTSNIFEANQAWYDLAIAIDPNDSDVIYTGELNMWKSSDGGQTFNKLNHWSTKDEAFVHADIHTLKFFNNTLFAGTDGGIYSSTDNGQSFTDHSNGLEITQFYRMDASSDSGLKIVGGTQDNAAFIYNQNNWATWAGGDGMDYEFDPTNFNRSFGLIQNGEILYTTNNNGEGQMRYPSDQSGNWITPLTINSEGRVFVGYNSVYEFSSGNWIKKSEDLGSSPIDELEAGINNPNILYAVQENEIFFSENNGEDFRSIATLDNPISDISISFWDDLTIYVATSPILSMKYYFSRSDSPKIYKISIGDPNGDTLVTDITGDLPQDQAFISIVHQPRDPKNSLYLGTSLGVYKTDDSLIEEGKWEDYSTNLPNVAISDLDINVEEEIIVASTYGRGIFSSPVEVNQFEYDLELSYLNTASDIIYRDDFIPEINILNTGTSTLDHVAVTTIINGIERVNNYDINLDPGDNTAIQLSPFDEQIKGLINLEVKVSNDKEVWLENNNKSATIFINQSSSPGKIWDGELASSELITYNDNYSESVWELGNPSGEKLNNVGSGSKAWATNLNGNYSNDLKDYLLSPYYNFHVIENPVLKLKMAFNIELFYDLAYVEYTIDEGRTWNKLGGKNSETNWYNYEYTYDNQYQLGWSGTSNDYLIMQEYVYDFNSNTSVDGIDLTDENRIAFRVVFESDYIEVYEGIVLDDFVIEGINLDLDDDGIRDTEDNCLGISNPEQLDTDQDGLGNSCDTDDDNDGVLDSEDAFPLDATESVDTDGDGIGNVSDTDDDGDGVLDTEDAFPLDATESVDTDEDGIGNNADTDDDGDGVLDTEDAFPLDATETYDADGDGIGDNADDDDDNDQIKDVNDECPNSALGVKVDTKGCEVFALPSNTFTVSVTSATCPDSSNGSITISSSNTDYSYRYAIDDQAPQALTDNTQTISNLSAGIYTVCVTVDGVADYQRCYTIEITEPAPLVASSRIDVSTRNLQLDLSGSEEYQVTLNGKTFLTSEDRLSLNLQPGMNRVEVATALDCQGVYFEEIFVSEEVKVYPNPTSGPLQLFVAGSDKEVTLSITSLSGSVIKKETLSVPTNRIIETTLGNVPEGLYLITLNGTTVKTTHKVIKE